MASLTDRMIRAAKLDVNLYEEVEADPQATGQAMTVVVLASLATGVGTLTTGRGMSGLIGGTVLGLLGWLIWAFLTYLIGTRVLPEPQTQANMGQLLRTIGFSSSPGVLRVLGLVPGLWTLATVVTSIWMLVAMVIAVRQALDYHSTWRAVGVCILGWIVQGVLLALLLPFATLSRDLGPAM
ncbi:MAG: YIP1 family protein [Acidobacteria bacterium]|nr:YIP1 family protein [Acidobacteriota bacterium]